MLRHNYLRGVRMCSCILAAMFLGGTLPVASAGADVKMPRSRISPAGVYANAESRLATLNRCGLPKPRHNDEGEDKTLSPYFVIQGSGDGTERLPLKETSAEVHIAGVIAQVRVRQVFANSGNRPIEATYVFPASTRAAVHGMRMRIGERTIEAKIDKRAQARADYEQARQEGKRASLLEQERANVFTMNVANIMPKDRIEVELDYSELLIPEQAVYEFVYPTVVGPRYGGGADPAKDKWIANPYLTEGKQEPYRFSLKAHLETGIALKDISSPSHKLTVDYRSPASADVSLAEPGGGNKDFILRYRLAGDQIESGALVYEEGDERFFVLMLEPPVRPKDAQVPPREYIFLLDVSGSMHGFPLNTAKELIRHLITALRPTDYFNVVLFAGASDVMSAPGSLPATSANINQAMAMIGRQRGGGGTELMSGLQAAYDVPKQRLEVSRSIVVVTDGFVGVEGKAFKLVHDRLNEANLFAFGIGSSVNRGLIEGMARAGLGEPFVVLRPETAAAQAAKLQEYIQYPVLTDISLHPSGVTVREIAPLKIPDLFARRPLVVFGKLSGEGEGAIEIRGMSGSGTRLRQRVVLARGANKPENAPLRYLWARKWVEMLDDQMDFAAAPEIEEAITDLGLSYNLLTRFTSFVAIDSEAVNKSGQATTVKQPLPLPEGVENSAVGRVGMATAAPKVKMRTTKLLGGGGGGSFASQAPRPSSAPAPGASSEVAGVMASQAPSADSAPAESRKANGRAPTPEPAKGVRVVSSKATSLLNTAVLTSLLQRTLQNGTCALSGRVTVTITIDAKGVIVALEIKEVAGGALAACLRKAMVGRASGATVQGAATGKLELVIEPAS